MNPTAQLEARQSVLTRMFDAPPDLVFAAWTKREYLIKWWGPKDFTVPYCAIDFRVGGAYRYCMRSPEGEEHWVWGKFQEIEPPERIVFTWDREDLEGNPRSKSVVTLTFSAEGEKTKLVLRQGVFDFASDCAEHIGGWISCLNRLAEFIQTGPIGSIK
jgi:uncharacterized protein YndB with AHSA1/START domain